MELSKNKEGVVCLSERLIIQVKTAKNGRRYIQVQKKSVAENGEVSWKFKAAIFQETWNSIKQLMCQVAEALQNDKNQEIGELEGGRAGEKMKMVLSIFKNRSYVGIQTCNSAGEQVLFKCFNMTVDEWESLVEQKTLVDSLMGMKKTTKRKAASDANKTGAKKT